jgi:hypothetical protein
VAASFRDQLQKQEEINGGLHDKLKHLTVRMVEIQHATEENTRRAVVAETAHDELMAGKRRAEEESQHWMQLFQQHQKQVGLVSNSASNLTLDTHFHRRDLLVRTFQRTFRTVYLRRQPM